MVGNQDERRTGPRCIGRDPEADRGRAADVHSAGEAAGASADGLLEALAGGGWHPRQIRLLLTRRSDPLAPRDPLALEARPQSVVVLEQSRGGPPRVMKIQNLAGF